MDADYYSIIETARMLGIKPAQLRYGASSGQLPAPIKIGKRVYYHTSQLRLLRESMVNVTPMTSMHYLTVRKIMQALCCDITTLNKINEGLGKTMGKRVYYTLDELALLRQRLIDYRKESLLTKRDWLKSRREKAGLYSQVEAAAFLKMPHVSFVYHIVKGHIPRPTRQHSYLMCYNAEDLDLIQGWVNKNYSANKK